MAGKITLSESNNETRIEWRINHFFIREDNLIISPHFILFKSNWFLQLHLGGKITFSKAKNDSCEPLRMSLLTLDPMTKYHIECRMGIQACNGSEITTDKFEWILNKRCGQTPQRLELISRKDFESSRNTLVTENTLTVFCTVRLMNVIKPAGNISTLISSIDSAFSSGIMLFGNEREMAGDIILDESKNETHIKWRILHFYNRKDTYINSPDFFLFNSKWLLKIRHADNFIESFSKPDGVSDSFLSMCLMILSASKAELHIEYEMGIQMSNGSRIGTGNLEALITSRFDQSLKERKIISRKDFDSVSDVLDSKNSLKAFCTVRLLSDDTSTSHIALLDFRNLNYKVCKKHPVGEITLNKSKHGIRIEWTINHFFVRENRLIESPNFILFKSNWYLVINIDNVSLQVIGNYSFSKKYLCMRLYRDHCSTDDHHIEYRMGIQRSDGSEVLTEKFESVFQPRFKKSLPERELISGEDLESLRRTLMTHGGTLKVFCTLRLLSEDKPVEIVQLPIKSTQVSDPHQETDHVTPAIESSTIFASSLNEYSTIVSSDESDPSTSSESSEVCICKGNHTLSRNFEAFYRSKILTDVTITVKDKTFHAHKQVLSARSDVFASMFMHGSSEERSGVVEVADCDPDSFEDFLLYLYAGILDIVSPSNAASLYKTADKYGMRELRHECVRCMSREMTMDSFCDIFHLASVHGEADLLAAATRFFIRNASAILVTKEWMSLLKEHPLSCNKLLVKFAKSGLQK